MECQRGDTVRVVVLRVLAGVALAAAGAVLGVSDSCAVAALPTVCVFGQTAGSSALLLILANAGLASKSSDNKSADDFMAVFPKSRYY